MINMLYCLVGRSSSGKSTIEKILCEKGYNRLISYTTRPSRANEVNGLDYHFITEERFKELESEGHFHEVAQYRDWNYGISLNDINLDDQTYIAVVTVHGYKELSKHTDNIRAIHIKVSEKERIIRQLNRGDDVDEVIRRVYTDREDFKDAETECHIIFENNNIDETAKAIENYIWFTNKYLGL